MSHLPQTPSKSSSNALGNRGDENRTSIGSSNDTISCTNTDPVDNRNLQFESHDDDYCPLDQQSDSSKSRKLFIDRESRGSGVHLLCSTSSTTNSPGTCKETQSPSNADSPPPPPQMLKQQQLKQKEISNLRRSISVPSINMVRKSRNLPSASTTKNPLLGAICQEAQVENPILLNFESDFIEAYNKDEGNASLCMEKQDSTTCLDTEASHSVHSYAYQNNCDSNDAAGVFVQHFRPDFNCEANIDSNSTITRCGSVTSSQNDRAFSLNSSNSHHSSASGDNDYYLQNTTNFLEDKNKDLLKDQLHKDPPDSPLEDNEITESEIVASLLTDQCARSSLSNIEYTNRINNQKDISNPGDTNEKILSNNNSSESPHISFNQQTAYSKFTNHPFYPLLSDLNMTCTHFEDPCIHASLLHNLPSDLNVLLYNFCRICGLQYPLRTEDKCLDEEIYFHLLRLHSELMSKIYHRSNVNHPTIDDPNNLKKSIKKNRVASMANIDSKFTRSMHCNSVSNATPSINDSLNPNNIMIPMYSPNPMSNSGPSAAPTPVGNYNIPAIIDMNGSPINTTAQYSTSSSYQHHNSPISSAGNPNVAPVNRYLAYSPKAYHHQNSGGSPHHHYLSPTAILANNNKDINGYPSNVPSSPYGGVKSMPSVHFNKLPPSSSNNRHQYVNNFNNPTSQSPYPTASLNSFHTTNAHHLQHHNMSLSQHSLNKRSSFPKEASEMLLSWLQSNSSNPYPTDTQKEQLRKSTGLTMVQINNWFTNARRRVLRRWKNSTASTATTNDAFKMSHRCTMKSAARKNDPTKPNTSLRD